MEQTLSAIFLKVCNFPEGVRGPDGNFIESSEVNAIISELNPK